MQLACCGRSLWSGYTILFTLVNSAHETRVEDSFDAIRVGLDGGTKQRYEAKVHGRLVCIQPHRASLFQSVPGSGQW